MNALDTNVLLRYFTRDDAKQTAQAARVIENATEPPYISLIVLAELVWTLESVYDVPSSEIVKILKHIAASNTFVLQNEAEVLYAISAMEEGYGFADALINALANWAGCESTLTFDRKASRLRGFDLL